MYFKVNCCQWIFLIWCIINISSNYCWTWRFAYFVERHSRLLSQCVHL